MKQLTATPTLANFWWLMPQTFRTFSNLWMLRLPVEFSDAEGKDQNEPANVYGDMM